MKKRNKTYKKKLTKRKKKFYIELTLVIAVTISVATISALDHNFKIEPAEAHLNVYNEKLEVYPPIENKIKDYVLKEVYKAGLNPEEAECLITHESNWDDYAYNINTNGTTDFGLWMINSIHKATISPKDRLDYKKATEWAINKRLHDGNWSAWYGYINNCI